MLSVVPVLWSFGTEAAGADWRVQAHRDDSNKLISEDGSVRLRIFLANKVGEPNKKYRLVWAVLPSDRYRMRVQVTQAGDIVTALKTCGGDLATTGGFTHNGKPEGWVISDSNPVSKPAEFTSGGAIIIATDKPHIIRNKAIEEYGSPGRVSQALQSKPILVYDGKYDGASEEIDSWNRAAIGVTEDGDLMVTHLDGETNSLADFARLLIAISELEHSPKLRAVLALDSRTSGHVFVRRPAAHFGARGKIVSSMICFEPKAK